MKHTLLAAALGTIILWTLLGSRLLFPADRAAQTPTPLASTQSAFSQPKFSGGVVTPDGRYRMDTDGTQIGMWDARTGAFVAFLKQNRAPVDATSLRFSADSQILTASGGAFLYTFNLNERRQTAQVFLIDQAVAAFSPDNTALVVFRCRSTASHGQCSEPSLTIWNTSSGAQIVDDFAAGWLHIQSLTFGEDNYTVTGRGCRSYRHGMFTMCANEGEIVWDLTTGERIHQRVVT